MNKKKTTLRVSFGKIIRTRRRYLELSQKAMGEKMGTHETYIGSIERGERNPTLEIIVKLSEALGCRASDLLRSIGE